jgi:hypothetical protein
MHTNVIILKCSNTQVSGPVALMTPKSLIRSALDRNKSFNLKKRTPHKKTRRHRTKTGKEHTVPRRKNKIESH